MAQHDDFDIIPDPAGQRARRPFSGWMWGVIILGVAFLAFAAGMASVTFTNRLDDGQRVAETPTTGIPTYAQTPLTTVLTATGVAGSTPTSQVAELATVAAAPTVQPTPLLTPTHPATCDQGVNAPLTALYQQNELGCAVEPGAVIWAAWEPFERGAMLWRSDIDRAYAFFNDGTWMTIDERWDNKEIPSRGDPPVGLQAPIRGFGYAWAIRADLFNRLGWATTEEKGFCALLQSFEGGFIFQSDTVEFCQEQLYNQARAPEWSPLRIVVTYDGIWRKQ